MTELDKLKLPVPNPYGKTVKIERVNMLIDRAYKAGQVTARAEGYTEGCKQSAPGRKMYQVGLAEGAAEERKRIKKWLLDNQTLETPELGKLVLWGWIYEVVNNKQALTTKEHHAE